MKKLTKKSDAERVFDVDKMFLKAEKDHIARAKHAARKGWYAQAMADDNSAHNARAFYRDNMFFLRQQFGLRRGE